MDRLTEHFEKLAQEHEATEASERAIAAMIAQQEKFAMLARLDRLLANEDVQWFLGEMTTLVDKETAEALSLRNSAETARQHAQRRDLGLTITGWIAKRRAQVASELQAAK